MAILEIGFGVSAIAMVDPLSRPVAARRSEAVTLHDDRERTINPREASMRAAIVWVVSVALTLAGCSNPHSSLDQGPLAGKIGNVCTVQFRRGDSLGAGGGSPVPPTTNAMNGAEVCVGGKLLSVGGGWVVVGAGETEYHIPRESILLIEFRK